MVNLQVLGEVAKVIVSVLLGSLIGYLVAKRTFSYQLWKQEAKTFYLNLKFDRWEGIERAKWTSPSVKYPFNTTFLTPDPPPFSTFTLFCCATYW